ncbi:MAG TPA: bifunctional glutamate N-acetyltransferase/amino-acid acetyltransferase ArgJ [Acidimicrobiales bacterium]|nr:bifunctional glutamate N-acetyltransferase/amino-acid acetyltransferase ArgJ [Acidimicrobiales bacterium]
MSVVAVDGFAAAGGHVGIKGAGQPDCAVVACTTPAPASAAAVFTTNLAAAAPVTVARAHLAATGGRARAVLVTSGNANAATGAGGVAGAEALCAAVGAACASSPTEVLLAQTGLIGVPFDFAGVAPAVAALCATAGTTDAHGAAAARAILTTDAVPKTHLGVHEGFRVGAMAKGAAMLAPNLATMLAVLTTDAACGPGLLGELLRDAVAPTFNRVHVDGSTSTNDTVCLLASGLAGPVVPERLGEALTEACASLARQMVDDAEGATRTATVTVSGATSDHQAHIAARAVAGSLLVKCSLHGADPYWGRVVAELGAAGVDFALDRVTVRYGNTVVCSGGEPAPHDAAAVAAHLARRQVELDCDLGLGGGRASVLCCDLGPGYLDENRSTS